LIFYSSSASAYQHPLHEGLAAMPERWGEGGVGVLAASAASHLGWPRHQVRPWARRAGRPLKALHGSTPNGLTRYVYYTLYAFWFRFVSKVDELMSTGCT
jgi:hypothetical protein